MSQTDLQAPGTTHSSEVVAPPPVDTSIEDPLQQRTPDTGPRDSGGAVALGDGLRAVMGGEEDSEQARGDEGTEAGAVSYEELLGKWLGGKVYAAIAPHLTLSKMTGYANQALDGAMPALKDALAGLDDDVDAAQLDAFGAALLELSQKGAGDWLKTDDGKRAESIAGWVDANPLWVSTIAVAAAAAFVLSNQSIPELAFKKLKLGEELTAGLKLKLGKTLALALEKIEVQLAVAAAQLTARYERDLTESDGEETLTEKAGVEVVLKDSYIDDKGEEQTLERLKGSVEGERVTSGPAGEDRTLESYTVGGSLAARLGRTGEDTLSLTATHSGDAAGSTTSSATLDYTTTDTRKDASGKDVEHSASNLSGKIDVEGGDVKLYAVKGDLMHRIDADTSLKADAALTGGDGETAMVATVRTESGDGKTHSVEIRDGVAYLKDTATAVVDGLTTTTTEEEGSDGSTATGVMVDGKLRDGLGVSGGYDEEVDGKTGARTSSASAGLTYEDDDTTAALNGKVGSDGSSEVSGSVEHDLSDELSVSAGFARAVKREGVDSAYQLTDTQRYTLGLELDRSELDVSLSSAIGTYGGDLSSAETSLHFATDSGFTGSGSVAFTKPIEDLKLSDASLWEVGASFGFKSKDRFEQYLLTYAWASEDDAHKVGALIEQQLDRFKLRLDSGVTYTRSADGVTDPRLKLSGGVLGAYSIGDPGDKDALLFGARYDYDAINGASVRPEVGVQLRGIPVTVDYDFKTKAVNLNVTVLRF